MKYIRTYNESKDLNNSEFNELKLYIEDILRDFEDDGMKVILQRDNPDVDVIVEYESSFHAKDRVKIFDINKYSDCIYSLDVYAKSIGFFKSKIWIEFISSINDFDGFNRNSSYDSIGKFLLVLDGRKGINFKKTSSIKITLSR